MIKYVWIVIIVLAHIIAIAYIANDVKQTFESYKERIQNIFDLVEYLEDTSTALVIIMVVLWFIISFFAWLVTKISAG